MDKNILKILRIEDLEEAEKELINGRVTGIHLSKSATINTAPYEFFKPLYGMAIDTQGLDATDLFTSYKIGNKILDTQMKIEAHNKLAEKLAMDSRIGYSMVNDIAYAWVSSICSFDMVWRIPEFELDQYSSRGKVAEAIFCEMLEGNPYPEDPEGFCITKDLQEDYAIMVNGSLGLTLEALSIKEQYENVKDHITNIRYQVRVVNDQHLYVGKADLFCDWDDVPGCFDIKATASLPNYNQVVLYAVCEPGTRKIGYIPIGASKTKRGFSRVKITDDIKGNFKIAIKKRNRFYRRFGF